MFKQDNTIKLVRTLNSQIVSINDNDKIIYANPDKTIMTEILGDDFVNQNTTTLGEKEFKEYFPQHKTSSFTKDVFDKLQKHGNIVESFNEPLENIQFEYDINKCRTHCWLNNKLGDYEVFGVSSQIEDYEGNTLRSGIYYVELVSLKDREFFMRGNTWYSKQFIEYGLKEGYNVNIKYQLLSTEVLDENHFKPFVNHIIGKYPKYYKDIGDRAVRSVASESRCSACFSSHQWARGVYTSLQNALPSGASFSVSHMSLSSTDGRGEWRARTRASDCP
jgi:hypothetical protein